MPSANEQKVIEILNDGSLSDDAKVMQLRELEVEVRGLQRAASESPMNADDGLEADLREVRLALEKLGAEDSPKGAATL
ncbi:hypothetical protein ABFT80_21835 [Mesorhizobium sp. SB112]|uniref:hypothetical protein n=1 Tax=Mesorhizobium sp. SB112 TaxID=3151853 RepID=UPI0032638D36